MDGPIPDRKAVRYSVCYHRPRGGVLAIFYFICAIRSKQTPTLHPLLAKTFSVMGHPLEYAFVYSTFTDNSKGGCPKTSLTLKGRGSDPTKHTLSWKEK